MYVTINGERCEIFSTTLEELFKELSLNTERVVTELNGTIIAKEAYAKTPLHADDVLEFVQFVGGG
ncbi:MAG: sulfur carrier protein ThiS [Desulfovibrio sp.]|nr:sulfur carrier protein ThiS [Desulfovibrio sp.]